MMFTGTSRTIELMMKRKYLIDPNLRLVKDFVPLNQVGAPHMSNLPVLGCAT